MFEPTELAAALRSCSSVEELPSLARRTAQAANDAEGAAAGACACAHAMLMWLYASLEGEVLDVERWDRAQRILGMLALLVEQQSDALLAGVGRAWQAFMKER